jgi:uncharacterized protein (DUF2267 family)
MSTTAMDVFEPTLQKTYVWLDEVKGELSLEDRRAAYQALRAALHALRDRLTVEEAVHLGAELPMLVRGFYYEGWHPGGKPLARHKSEFLNNVGNELRPRTHFDPEHVVRAVFKVLAKHVSKGEIDDVKRILPEELRDLWSAAESGKSG